MLDFIDQHINDLDLEIRDFVKNLPDNGKKADFFRFFVLYELGGIYADIDVEPTIPIK